MKPEVLPPDPTDFWVKKWLFGIIASSGSFFFGVHSIATQHSYAIAKRVATIAFVEVEGFQASLMGAAYIGGGIALFSYCFAPYSEAFADLATFGLLTGLVIAAAAMCWCSWIFILQWQ